MRNTACAEQNIAGNWKRGAYAKISTNGKPTSTSKPWGRPWEQRVGVKSGYIQQDSLAEALQAVDKIAARYNKLLDDALREAA